MSVTLDIHRATYGRLVLDEAAAVAGRFFEEDVSSHDAKHPSYDDRAAQCEDFPQYDDADTIAVRRGMRLNRAPQRLWQWVREEVPVDLLAALPASMDLIDAEDAEFLAVWESLEAALGGGLSPRSPGAGAGLQRRPS